MRAALRLLASAGASALGLAALALVVVGTVAGGARARATLLATRAGIYERLGLADLELRISPTQRGVLTRPRGGALSSTPLPAVIAWAEERALVLGRLTGGGARGVLTLVRVLPAEGPPRLDRLEIEPGGHYPGPEEAALVVDRSVRDLFGLGLGARATLRVGAEERELPIVGVALSPEHLMAPAHPAYGLPLKGTAAVVGVSWAAVKDVPRAGQTSSLLFGYEDGWDESREGLASLEETVLAEAQDMGLHVRESVPTAREPGRLFSDFLLTQFDLYLPAMVGAFALLGLLLLALFTARGVDRRRREVGVRLALGQTPWSIVRAFLPAPIAGTLLGLGLGAWLHGPVAAATAGTWGRSMGFPPLVDAGAPWAVVLLAGAATLLTALAAGALPVLRLARRAPARLLHESALSAPRPPGILGKLLARARGRVGLAPPLALALAGVARRRRDTLGAILGVGLSVALVLAFLAVHVSHRVEAREAIQTSTRSATLHFDEPQGPATLASVAQALEGTLEPLVARMARLATPGGLETRRLWGVAAHGWVETQALAEGRHLSSDEAAEALIDVWVARRDGLGVGSTLTLFPDPQAPEGETLTVVGVLDGMSMGRLLVPLGVARRMYTLGEGSQALTTGAIVASPLNADVLEARLAALSGVGSFMLATRAVEQVDSAFSGSLGVLMLGLFAAVGVALLVLGLLALEDRRERAPEIALLDALGWRAGDLALVTVGEVLARGVPALLLAGLLAPWLAGMFLARIEAVNHYRVALHVPPWLVLAVLGPALLLLPLAALPALRRARAQAPGRALRRIAPE